MSTCGEKVFRGELAALWVETVMWGVYGPLYVGCMYTLIMSRKRKIMATLLSLNFLLSSLLMILRVWARLSAPIDTCFKECSVLEGCHSCFAETATIKHQVDLVNLEEFIWVVLFFINQFISDVVLIGRCYIIWDRRISIIALPMLCLLASTATAIYTACISWALYSIRLHAPISEADPPPNFVRDIQIDTTLLSLMDILPMVTNIVVTILIVGRILYMTYGLREIGNLRQPTRIYRFTVFILIESGALVVVAYILQACGSWLNSTLSDLSQAFLNQIVGIAPTLLLIQVTLSQNTYSHTEFLEAVAPIVDDTKDTRITSQDGGTASTDG